MQIREFVSVVIGAASAMALCACPALADDNSDLRSELLNLKQELERLKKHVQSQSAAPVGAAGPVVVTQQPGNFPGRATGGPGTSSAPGAPGGPEPVAAAPVSSGGNAVTLSVSGQVNRALLFGDDGFARRLKQVDNSNSGSRLRFVGEGRFREKYTAGMNLEVGLQPQSSGSTTLTQGSVQSVNSTSTYATFYVRQLDVYFAN